MFVGKHGLTSDTLDIWVQILNNIYTFTSVLTRLYLLLLFYLKPKNLQIKIVAHFGRTIHSQANVKNSEIVALHSKCN
jgi:hypothetical protein